MISTDKEVDIGMDEGCDKQLHPANMLLYLWDEGLDVCVDLIGSSPLTQTGMADFVSGCVVIDAAQHKCVKCMAKYVKLIMEYLVKDSKRRAFWRLNEDILKITILKTNTPYPSRKIRRIRACTHQRPQRNEAQYAVSKRCQYAVLKI
ncbi:hypothetical protein Tco_1466026 [Tanacetum coccineum]